MRTEFKPGQVLTFIIPKGSVKTTVGDYDLKIDLSYDDLLSMIRRKGDGSSRKSKTEGRYYSRVVSLNANAAIRGMWDSGSPIDPFKATSNIVTGFYRLNPRDYETVSPAAILHIKNLIGYWAGREKYDHIIDDLKQILAKLEG